MLARLGKRAWPHCGGCRHSIMIEPQHPLVWATADTPAGVRDRRISAPIRFSVPLLPREEINHVATPLAQRAH